MEDINYKNNQPVAVFNKIDKDTSELYADPSNGLSDIYGDRRPIRRGRALLGDGVMYITIAGLLATDTFEVGQGSANVTVSNDRIDIANLDKVYLLKLYRSGVLIGQYNLEEENGSVMFNSDTSLLLPNATIESGSSSNYDTQNIYSYANIEGLTISDGSTYYYDNAGVNLIPEGVIIPRDMSNPSKCCAYLAGGEQADLQFKGKNPNFGNIVSRCFKGGGSSVVRFQSSVSDLYTLDSYSMSVNVEMGRSITAGEERVLSYRDSATELFLIEYKNDELKLVIRDSSGSAYSVAYAYPVYDHFVNVEGRIVDIQTATPTIELLVNEVVVGSATYAKGTNLRSSELSIGGAYTGSANRYSYQDRMYDFVERQSGVATDRFPLLNGVYEGVTHYSVLSNNIATLHNPTGANYSTQDEFSYLHKYGFRATTYTNGGVCYSNENVVIGGDTVTIGFTIDQYNSNLQNTVLIEHETFSTGGLGSVSINTDSSENKFRISVIDDLGGTITYKLVDNIDVGVYRIAIDTSQVGAAMFSVSVNGINASVTQVVDSGERNFNLIDDVVYIGERTGDILPVLARISDVLFQGIFLVELPHRPIDSVGGYIFTASTMRLSVIPATEDTLFAANGHPINRLQNGNRLLDSGEKSQVYLAPEYIQSDKTEEIYFNAVEDVIPQGFDDYAINNLANNQYFNDVSKVGYIEQMRFHFRALNDLQAETDKRITNCCDTVIPVVLNNFLSYNPTGSSSGGKKFTAYIQDETDGSTYYGFEVEHQYDMSEAVYTDQYRLIKADMYTHTGGVMVATGENALATGESECVYRTPDKVDFTGGWHGDEVLSEIAFLVDNVELTSLQLVSAFDLLPCNEFRYIQTSTTHETASSIDGVNPLHPVEAIHVKNTVFSDSGYVTYNSLTWQEDLTISIAYLTLVSLAHDTGEFGQTSTSSVVTFDRLGDRKLEEINDNVRVWNNTTDYEATVNSTFNVYNNSSEAFIWDNANYNKYYRNTGEKAVLDGDFWESVTEVKFNKM